jgi:hypothetical protein
LTIEPPDDLKKLIFLFVENVPEQLRQGSPTLNSFLKLLVKLRTIILQDIAALSLKGREHILCSLPVFSSEAFIQFRKRLAEVMETNEGNQSAAIDAILPGLNQRLVSQHSHLWVFC